MRPDRRWWIFILAMAIAWGGRWWLAGRRPGPAADRPGGEVTPDPPWRRRRYPSRTGPTAEPDPPISAAATDSKAHPDDGQPPAPPELAEGPNAPEAVSGLEKLSVAEEPGPLGGEATGLDRLPGVDDQLERATAVDVIRPSAADIRRGERAQQAGQARRRRAVFPRGGPEAGREAGRGPEEARRGLLARGPVRRGPRAGRGDLARAPIAPARVDEARAMLEFHLAMGLNPLPIDRMQAALDRAIEQAPQDDRVWLGRGYLALRQGRLDRGAIVVRRLPAADGPTTRWSGAPGSNGRSPLTASAEASEALPHLAADDDLADA